MKLFLYFVIVFSAVFHEYAHGFIAESLGDPTAKYAGRLTLNPIVHMELFGTVLLPLFLLFAGGFFIGWARPVPYNPYNLSDPKYGSLKVALAGPATNLLIAIILGLFLRLSPFFSSFLGVNLLGFLGIIVYINIALAFFNLIPLPPLDGAKVLADLFPRASQLFMQLGGGGLIIALFFAFFFLPVITNFVYFIIVGTSLGI